MNKFLFLIAFPLLAGCSATMETRLSKSSPNAPVNEINGGVVSYLNQGYSGAIASRRNDAYKKMHDACNGDYKIVQEGEHLGDGLAMPIGQDALYSQERRIQIKFECVDKQLVATP